METIVSSDYTIPPDQIIQYPPVSNDSRYTFSLFAFPEDEFPAALTSFFKFCNDYYSQKGYRSNLLYVGYRIAQDQKALLSYSYDGTVMTIDPVSTANPGWEDFLVAYNQFCVNLNGKPLLNQTPGLTAAIRARSLWRQVGGSCGNTQAIRSAEPLAERLFPPTTFVTIRYFFPVSAAMLRDRAAYDKTFENFSSSILPLIHPAVSGSFRGCEREMRHF